jgi:hypothetical protein
MFERQIDAQLIQIRGAHRLTSGELVTCFGQLFGLTASEESWSYAVRKGAYEAVVAAMRERADDA